MNERIAELEAEVEALFDLTTRAYARFIFLRPMLTDKQLHDRIGKEARAIGFRQLRNWLYWALVQELTKICSDKDRRSPSITTVTQKLRDVRLRNQLEEKCVKKNREMGEAQVRASFARAYFDYERRAEEVLSSHSVGSYKTVRDKLISHNELRRSPSGYGFFDVKEAKLKYGDERKLLETLKVLIDHLLLIVRNIDFSWDSFFRNEERDARDFWELNAT
jgi:HEPN superfamily AbiU2-like protein